MCLPDSVKDMLTLLTEAASGDEPQYIYDWEAFTAYSTEATLKIVGEKLDKDVALIMKRSVQRTNGMLAGEQKRDPDNFDGSEGYKHSLFITNLTSNLKHHFSKAKKASGQKKATTEKAAKPKTSAADMVKYFEELCIYEGINDLITGNLHRLDPVIGDFGCQWRVPFVIDLHNEITRYLGEEKDYDQVTIGKLVEGYYASRKDVPTLQGMLGSKAVAANIRPLDKSRLNSEYRKMIDVAVEWLKKWNKALWAPVRIETGKDGDALRYLQLCKIMTINRVRYMDAFCLSGGQDELKLPYSKKQQGRLYPELARDSRCYMLHIGRRIVEHKGVKVVEKDGRLVADWGDGTQPECATLFNILTRPEWYYNYNGVRATTHSFYGPFRLLFMYQSTKVAPIIIDLKRLRCIPAEGDEMSETGGRADYTYMGGAILYYEPDEKTGEFRYIAKPSEKQMQQVGMCVECFSIYRPDAKVKLDEQESFLHSENMEEYITGLTEKCSITDLVCIAAYNHASFPTNAYRLEDGKEVLLTDSDVKALQKEAFGEANRLPGVSRNYLAPQVPLFGGGADSRNIVHECTMLEEFLTRLGLENMEYKYQRGKFREKPLRAARDIPFAVIHIYGCTYAIKQREFTEFLAGGRYKTASRRTILRGECVRKD